MVRRNERITCPSRNTTFPLFASELGDGWLQLLNLTMRCGTLKSTSEGDRLAEVLNAVLTVELAGENETPPTIFELSSDEPEAHYQRLMSASSHGQANRTCGKADSLGAAEQLQRTIERLTRSHDTRSGSIVLLRPTDSDTQNDAPTIISATFNTVDGRLFGTFVLRGEDIYGVWPLNALSLIRLQRVVAESAGTPVDAATFILQSAHIYERDWDSAQKTLDERFKRPLPLQTDPAGLFLFGIDNGRARGMLIDHEANDVLWEGEFDDPEEMAWYIVDVMPWLSPQHIRYVGEECARLKRALREGEEYEQG